MKTIHFLIVMITVVTGNVFVGCKGNVSASPSQNIFYKVTHQAETFGFDSATFYQLQIAFNQKKPLDFKQAFYYYNYGCGYYHTNKADELTALKYADSMLLACEMLNPQTDQAEIAIANLSEGDILFALKRYNEAIAYYYKGKMAADKSGDQYTMSEYSYRLGIAMYRKEKYNAAAVYFTNAFEQSGHRNNNSFSDFYRRQEVLDNAALSYLYSGKPDSAIWYCQKGIRFIADNTGKYMLGKEALMQAAKGVIYGTVGRAYLQMHDTTGAGWLQKSIAINIVPGGENGNALQMQVCLAKYYLDSSFGLQLPKAYAMLLSIQHGLDTLQNNDAALQWNALMSRYFALQGNTALAYTYLRKFNTLHDQQITASQALAETNINNLMKLLQDRNDMRQLRANDGIKTIYLLIAVLISLLTGIILFLIVRSWKKEKRNTLALAVLNAQVEQQKTALEDTVKQLAQQIKTKDYILRVIAHDLRNPISAISTLTRIVSEEYENEEENREFLEIAQSACKDSLAMIDSIMQLAQQENKESLNRRVFDVNEAVLDCIELLRFKAQEKEQSLVLHTAKAPQYTYADVDKIVRVVNNLVINAIKFSFPNSTIDVYVKDKKEHIEIEVKDEGIGIPPDMQDKVFNVFTEARRKGTSKEGTFGLGLSICKQLVEAHDGKIWLVSKEGFGTVFYVQLHKHLLLQPEPELEAEAV